MKNILSIIVLTVLVASCATKPSNQAYDYINDPPVKFGQPVQYAINAPVIFMEGEIFLGIEYETNSERSLSFSGAKIELKEFLIESPKSHAHVKCGSAQTTLFVIDGERYILDLRSENPKANDNILTIWREQEFRGKIDAEQKALGMALHEELY